MFLVIQISPGKIVKGGKVQPAIRLTWLPRVPPGLSGHFRNGSFSDNPRQVNRSRAVLAGMRTSAHRKMTIDGLGTGVVGHQPGSKFTQSGPRQATISNILLFRKTQLVTATLAACSLCGNRPFFRPGTTDCPIAQTRNGNGIAISPPALLLRTPCKHRSPGLKFPVACR
jgi:hypothetical protein